MKNFFYFLFLLLLFSSNIIAKDIENVRLRVAEAQKKITEDQSLLNALMGAFQQCEAFAKDLDNDESEMVSDVENSEDPDEAIGGTD